MHPYFFSQVERHFRRRQQERLVEQQAAHIAIQRDRCPFARMQILTELGREIEDPVGFLSVQHPLRLLHIRQDGDDLDIGRSIHTTGKLAT